MSLFKRFKNFGSYKAFVKCPNCGFGSEVKVPKGISVTNFVKDGKCKCDSCGVVFFPNEYTTKHFEEEKNKDFNKFVKPKAKLNLNYKKFEDFTDKNVKGKNIKWV